MKAVVIHEYGPPSVLKYEDFPDPVVGEGEVLVKISAASINPVDWKMRSGEAKARFPVEFPGILGRDLSGVVRALGPGVTGFEPGDRVMAFTPGTYAELAVVKASDLVKVPEGLDTVEAAALPLVTLTGEQLIRLGTGLQKDQTVLITGALGAVGRSAVWTALSSGARVIAGVRKKQLEQVGAVRWMTGVQPIALDDEQAIAKLGFLDAVADTVGGATADTLLGKVKPGGAFGSVLGPPANAGFHPTLRVVPVRTAPDSATLRKLAEDVAAKRFEIPIDRMVALADAAQAHAVAEKGGIGKILLLA